MHPKRLYGLLHTILVLIILFFIGKGCIGLIEKAKEPHKKWGAYVEVLDHATV